MIKYLKIHNHKALVFAELNDLGNINIICGKNNSGKTTILEALLNKNCYGIGKMVEGVDWLANLFTFQANKYASPSPGTSESWFKEYVEELIKKNTIWFTNERKEIIQKMKDSMKRDPFLGGFSNEIFDFESLLNTFFEKSIAFYNPILIPPKRQIEFEKTIEVNQGVTPAGLGILNNLFFLKNQDFESNDFKKYSTILDIFFEITGSRFNIITEQNNQIRLFYKTDGMWIPAADSGLGLSDVLAIISLINIIDANIFFLEEPENHLHAGYQKKLLKYLRGLKTKQFIITTHSSIFLDTNMVDKIFFCQNNGKIILSDQTSKSEIINSLGYSVTENLVADLLILVEGPTDIPVIKEILSWSDINSTFNIKFWPLGGDIMASLDLSVFAERKNVFALIDSDPGSSAQRTRFIKKCKENGVYCKQLERYSIENYFSINALRKTFPRQIPEKIKELSPKESVDVQIGFKEKNKTVKTKNSEIIKYMGMDDIKGTDLYEFLLDIQDFFQTQNTK